MRYLSVCSGIEAASVAWHGLGWNPAGFSEIEPFPSAVLKERFPDVTNYGDMTKFKEWENVGTVDLLVGGTPCQSFSVAGLRKGLTDPRGNLMLTFGAIANHFKARWIVWENVPGVLSSNKGRDFGTFLGMLAECGYGFAYRVLDAQFFGVPQRRRRVFVVGCLGNWLAPAKVLFDSESLSGNPPPSRKKGEGVAAGAERNAGGDCRATWWNGSNTAYTITCTSNNQRMPDMNRLQCVIQKQTVYEKSGTGGGNLPIVMAHGQANAEITHDVSPTLTRLCEQPIVLRYSQLRRLTPKECERLQGFPDNWTQIPWKGKPAEQCPDGLRYKACGNSMAVPVMRWIGERIDKQEKEDNRHED